MSPPTASLLALAPIVMSLWQSVFSSWGAVLLVLAGSVSIIAGAVAMWQTRRWPQGEPVSSDEEEDDQTDDAEPPATPEAPKPRVARPATTTDVLRIRFPQIDERHPDVWDHQTPLRVMVLVERGRIPDAHARTGALQVTLHAQFGGNRTTFDTTAVDDDGRAIFEIAPNQRGEFDLVADLRADDTPQGQAVRAIRLVDYRAEIIETFEDFVAWAASQFGFVDRKRTAREFVDMFIDGRPGCPAAPLDTVVDLYEIANFSDHPVDRQTYLQLVDAFLELEEAGALEGAEED